MRILGLAALLIISFNLFSQTDVDNSYSPDEMFTEIRNLADNGDLATAKTLSLKILSDYPEYTDVRIYLALLYGREGEYETGINQLEQILVKDSANIQALLAMTDLDFWSNDWTGLLKSTELALSMLPDDADLKYKKALAAHMLGDEEGAMQIIDSLIISEPEDQQVLDLKKNVLIAYPGKEFFLKYYYDHFRQPYIRRWHMLSAGINLPVPKGIISPSLNAGHFVDTSRNFISSSGIQFNVESYLDITPKNQLLLGYGISGSEYFPKHRAIIHIWQTLPQAWAVSAGLRYFYFDSHYIFYALGVEKYQGNYWFELKNYIFKKEYGLSLASYLTARRYWETKYDYVSATIGYGTSPDEPLTSILDLQRLNALSIQINVMHQISGLVRIHAGIGYQYEEFADQVFRNRYSIQAALFYKIISR